MFMFLDNNWVARYKTQKSSWQRTDVDPGPQGACLVAVTNRTNSHGLQKSCGQKGTAWQLFK